DADGATLGRLATRVATLLRGKHKPSFSPHLDTGDPVVVVNAAKVKVTGNKLQAKLYIRHSGYPGGLRKETLERLLSRRPEEVVAVATRTPPDDYSGADGAAERAPLRCTGTHPGTRLRARVKVEAGGVPGRVGATAPGIPRALLQVNKEPGPTVGKAGPHPRH